VTFQLWNFELQWKKLTEEEKKQYEVRAQYIAEEREKADALAPPASARLQPGQIRVHCCKWQGCDYQFDTQDLLYDHIKTLHTSQISTFFYFIHTIELICVN
jgi:hypothetical protein